MWLLTLTSLKASLSLKAVSAKLNQHAGYLQGQSVKDRAEAMHAAMVMYINSTRGTLGPDVTAKIFARHNSDRNCRKLTESECGAEHYAGECRSEKGCPKGPDAVTQNRSQLICVR